MRRVYKSGNAMVVANSRRQAKAFLKYEGLSCRNIEIVRDDIPMVADDGGGINVVMTPPDVVVGYFPGPGAKLIPEL